MEGPMGPRGLGPKTIKLWKSLKIMKITCFFQHGKDAHQNSAKGALNDSSRSLIWNFLEQKRWLEKCQEMRKCVYTQESLVYAQEISCACTTLLCMLWAREPRGQGPKKATKKSLVYKQEILFFQVSNVSNGESRCGRVAVRHLGRDGPAELLVARPGS